MLMKWIDILERVLNIIPLFCVAIAALWIIFNKEKNLFNVVKHNLKALGRYLVILLVLPLLWGGIHAATNLVTSSQVSRAILRLNYLEASSGLTPNKTKFTASSLLADPIMEKVIEKGNYFDLDPEVLRSGFTIKLLNRSKEVSLEKPYIPTEYSVTFQLTEETSGLRPARVLELYGEVLTEYFTSSYSRKTNVLELDFSDLEQADYMDIDEIFNTKATELQRYMSACSTENGTFISSKTGESFRTLNQKILNYKDVAIENYHAFVLKNGISKNRSQYIGKMNYNNRILDTDYRKNLAAYRISLDVIQMYERDMARIVLVPTRDLGGEFYMSRTKIGVDNFSKGAEDAATRASSLSKDISSNNYKIEQLRANSGNFEREADAMIETLKEDLLHLATLAMETVQDYDEQSTENYITILYSDEAAAFRSSLTSAVKSAIVFFGLLLVLCLLKPEKHRERKR